MRKLEKITQKIEADKDMMRQIANEHYYSVSSFISDLQTYLKAVADGRILYRVESVSKSGMSRQIAIQSCERSTWNNKISYHYRQYQTMLGVLGYTKTQNETIRVSGCGMNMCFATNYSIIRKAYALGFISLKQCLVLEQRVS